MGLPGLMPPNFLQSAEHARDFAVHHIDRVISAIMDVRDAVDALDTREETVWRRRSVVADATGLALITFNGPRAGYTWKIERVTTNVVNGAASIGTVMLGEDSAGNTVLILPDADLFAEDVGNGIHVAPLVPVLVRITGAPVGSRVTAALQIVETTYPEG